MLFRGRRYLIIDGSKYLIGIYRSNNFQKKIDSNDSDRKSFIIIISRDYIIKDYKTILLIQKK